MVASQIKVGMNRSLNKSIFILRKCSYVGGKAFYRRNKVVQGEACEQTKLSSAQYENRLFTQPVGQPAAGVETDGASRIEGNGAFDDNS